MAFEIGDVVWLKSGGVPMTVSGKNSEGAIFTKWHNLTAGGVKDEAGGPYKEAMLTDKNPASVDWQKTLEGMQKLYGR